MYVHVCTVCVYIYTCNTYIITSRILTHVGVSGFEYLDSPKERPILQVQLRNRFLPDQLETLLNAGFFSVQQAPSFLRLAEFASISLIREKCMAKHGWFRTKFTKSTKVLRWLEDIKWHEITNHVAPLVPQQLDTPWESHALPGFCQRNMPIFHRSILWGCLKWDKKWWYPQLSSKL